MYIAGAVILAVLISVPISFLVPFPFSLLISFVFGIAAGAIGGNLQAESDFRKRYGR